MRFSEYFSENFVERNKYRTEQIAVARLQGSEAIPDPPRDIQCTSASRGILVTWKLPVVHDRISSWRIYRDTESNLIGTVEDKGNRKFTVPATAAASGSPVTNIFVSSISYGGGESAKIRAKGTALDETANPTSAAAAPSPPPGYSSETSGGNQDTDTGNDVRRGRGTL